MFYKYSFVFITVRKNTHHTQDDNNFGYLRYGHQVGITHISSEYGSSLTFSTNYGQSPIW